MNPDTIADLSYFDRLRVIRTLQYSGNPVPIPLILEHLRHSDQIYAIPKVEFEFCFKGHSQEVKDLWASVIFAPIEISDSEESDQIEQLPSSPDSETDSSQSDHTEIQEIPKVEQKEPEKALDFIPLESNQVPDNLKRKYPFLQEQIKVKISKDSTRQVQFS
jgi:hypothetical protein